MVITFSFYIFSLIFLIDYVEGNSGAHAVHKVRQFERMSVKGDFVYKTISTRVDTPYNEFPNIDSFKWDMDSHDTIFGDGCEVQLDIELIDFAQLPSDPTVTLCLFKANVAETAQVFLPSMKLSILGETFDPADYYQALQPVTGFLMGEMHSLVQGSIINKFFYGTVRVFDPLPSHHTVFYVEPFSNLAYYHSGLKGKEKKPGHNGAIFEFIRHEDDKSNSANSHSINNPNGADDEETEIRAEMGHIIQQVKHKHGITTSTMFDIRNRNESISCEICVYVQPNFAKAFGLGNGVSHGVGEIITLLKNVQFVFQGIDFNGDLFAEEIYLVVKEFLVSDTIDPSKEAVSEPGPQAIDHEDYPFKINEPSKSGNKPSYKAPVSGNSASSSAVKTAVSGNSASSSAHETPVSGNSASSSANEAPESANSPGSTAHETPESGNSPGSTANKTPGSGADESGNSSPTKKKRRRRQIGAAETKDEEEEKYSEEVKFLDGEKTYKTLRQQLNKYFGNQHCGVTLAYLYHNLAPTITLSSLGGACSLRNTLGIISGNLHMHKIGKFDVFRGTMHALGHLFGAKEDDVTNPVCKRDKIATPHFINNLLMESTQPTDLGIRPNSMRYSPCAKEWMTRFLQSPMASCLRTIEHADNRKVCGNGVIEEGEECDCGSIWQCHAEESKGPPCCGESDGFLGCKQIGKRLTRKSGHCHRPWVW